MKRFLIILLFAANSTSFCAQSVTTETSKNLMVNCINSGKYHKAIQHVKGVKDWHFAIDQIDLYIKPDKAREFLDYCERHTQNSVLDSFKIYLAHELEFLAYYEEDKGNLNLSLVYISDAHSLFASVMGETHSDALGTLNAMSEIYFNIGEYTKAYEYLSQYINLTKEVYGDNSPEYFLALQNKGALCCYLGDYELSESCLLQVKNYLELHMDAKAYGKVLNNLGLLYKDMGDYPTSIEYFNKALFIKSQNGENNTINYAVTLFNIGLLKYHQGSLDDAERIILEAIEIYDKYNVKDVSYLLLLETIGEVYYHMRDYPDAKNYLSYVLSMLNEVPSPNKIIDQNMRYISYLIYDNKDYKLANEVMEKAKEANESCVGKEHDSNASFLIDLARINSHLDIYVADSLYRVACEIDKNAFIKNSQFLTEKQRERYWIKINDFKTYSSFAYRQHEAIPSISCFMYNIEIFTKGLLLQSSDMIKRSVLESNDSTLVCKWNELAAEKRLIINLQVNTPLSPYVAEHQERAEQLEKEITKSSAAYRENQAMWEITWDSVRNQLSSYQVAIEYMTAPLNEDSTMYCAIMISKDCEYPKVVPLFEEKEVTALVNTNTENLTSYTYSYNGNGNQLSQLVWSKILPYIKQGETVYFAPSGILHQLAIEALPYDENHTMGDMYNLVRLSSTREIVKRKDEVRQSSTATLYGGIQYNMDADELLTESEAYKATDILASRGIESDTLNRGTITYLKGTKAEAENINALLKQNNLQVQLFTAKNANEESFKALSGKHRNILHIATHGFYWTDSTAQKKDYFSQRMVMRLGNDAPAPPKIDPLNRCGLLFAGAQTAWSGHSADLPEGVQDGILTAKEISLLDLRDADLVVLSACETGKGEITGDGVFGLQRAFKQAGAQTIIMSLWPVNDAATQLLMTEFYRNWIINHQSKREAFRNAQNTVRSQYEEPIYWAGFIMLD